MLEEEWQEGCKAFVDFSSQKCNKHAMPATLVGYSSSRELRDASI